MNRQPTGMAEDFPKRHLFLFGKLIVRHLPRLQLIVDVLIQIELSLFHQVQDSG